MIEVEVVEVRSECSQELEQLPLKMWKGIMSSGDVEFFRNGVSDAQRVSFPLLILLPYFAATSLLHLLF